ncbi:MAG: chemotaxis protein CheA [Thermodesulfobacteriota bacterium]|nr:chemotaxis protein CheA [Thermodesulfobacteriota bacterium]
MTDGNANIDENVSSFVAESREMIEEVEPSLIELGSMVEQSGKVDDDTTNMIFRLFHSIKGTAGFLQFEQIVKLTHEAETLLDMFRSGKSAFSSRDTDMLCRTCDTLTALLARIEETGKDTGLEGSVEAMVAELNQRIVGDSGGKAAAKSKPAKGTGKKSTKKAKGKKGKGKAALVSKTADTPPEDTDEAAEADEEQAARPAEYDIQMALMTPEMIQGFTLEGEEQLEQVEASLLELENTPDNMEHIEEAYRLIHSFKGNCGFMGFADFETLSHRAETYLDGVKSGLVTPDSSNIPTLLHVVDVLRNGIADVSKGGEGKIDNLQVLLDLLDDITPEAAKAPKSQKPAAEKTSVVETDTGESSVPDPAEPVITAEGASLLREEGDDDEEDDDGKGPAKPSPEAAMKVRAINRKDIRVDLVKLDHLINLVGELVIAESMVRRNPDLEGYEFDNFERAAAQMNKIVRDLQDIALSVRMLPISGVFRKMIRLVHDLSNKAGKKVDLELLGEETEIDKTVSELIADPLVHLVRNSLDHGIETPEERVAAGKDPVGKLILEAKYEGGEVWISISDDGRGLDRERILAKAFERDLIKGDTAAMTDEEVFDLIFKPGFSTAAEVTDISGRGVGMDVVRRNIEKINGHVEIRSKPGQGSLIILSIPLTLAIIEGMLVRVGQAYYIISLLSIRESIQVEKSMITVTMDGQELIRFREEFVPVIRLHELHEIQADNTELVGGLVVIVGTQEESAAIMIDELLGEQQAVVKGLSEYIGNVKGVSGCTIQGDGTISLILDTGGLIKRARGQKNSQAA